MNYKIYYNKMSITDDYLNKLLPQKTKFRVEINKHLFLEILPNGSKIFVWRYEVILDSSSINTRYIGGLFKDFPIGKFDLTNNSFNLRQALLKVKKLDYLRKRKDLDPSAEYYKNICDELRKDLKDNLKTKTLNSFKEFSKKLNFVRYHKSGYLPLPIDIINYIESNKAEFPELDQQIQSAYKTEEKLKRKGIDFYPDDINYLTDLKSSIQSILRLYRSSPRNPKNPWPSKSRVLTFGSCFALNIHKKLYDMHLNSRSVLMFEELNSPMYNLIGLSSEYIFNSNEGQFITSNKNHSPYSKIVENADKLLPNSNYDFIFSDGIWNLKRLQDRFAILKKEIKNADNIIFTVGTAIERNDKGRTYFVSVDDQTKSISNVVSKIKAINPDINIVLTLSPVPTTGVWGLPYELSAVEADCIQKSISRCAIYNFFLSNKNLNNISYFPSYEIVRWLAPYSSEKKIWIDPFHLSPVIIDSICESFVISYFNI